MSQRLRDAVARSVQHITLSRKNFLEGSAECGGVLRTLWKAGHSTSDIPIRKTWLDFEEQAPARRHLPKCSVVRRGKRSMFCPPPYYDATVRDHRVSFAFTSDDPLLPKHDWYGWTNQPSKTGRTRAPCVARPGPNNQYLCHAL